MATRTATQVGSGVQPKGLRVGLVAVTSTFSLAAAQSLVAGDVIQMVKVPANATLVYMGVSGGSGDALVTVGDGVDDDRYLSAVTMSSAQPLIRTINTAYVPYTYSTDDTIDIAVSTVSVATITGGFNMIAIFSMNPGVT